MQNIMTTINDQPQHLLARYADRTGCKRVLTWSKAAPAPKRYPPISAAEEVRNGATIRIVLSEYGLPSHLKPYKDNPRIPGDGYRVPTGQDKCNQPHERWSDARSGWIQGIEVACRFINSTYMDYRLAASVPMPDWDEMTREDAPADALAKLPRPEQQPQDEVQVLKARVQELDGDYQMMQGSLLSILGELDCEEPASALLKLKEMKGERDAWMRTAKTRKHHLDHLEAQLAAASTPTLRPIAEMPAEVPEGCVRWYGRVHETAEMGVFNRCHVDTDTHFIDIRLPDPPDPDEELRRKWEGLFSHSDALKQIRESLTEEQVSISFQAYKAGRAKEGAR